ncbi:MAG: hypothetical protein WAW37_00610 [Syntrophobacteraceae bacterium]
MYEETISKLRANAEFVIKQLKPLSGIDFGYNDESVAWLDGYINDLRKDALPKETLVPLVGVLGSFLGECVIHRFGGTWQYVDGRFAVAFDDLNMVFPLTKVEKQFQDGPEESVLSFFTNIPLIYSRTSPDTADDKFFGPAGGGAGEGYPVSFKTTRLRP